MPATTTPPSNPLRPLLILGSVAVVIAALYWAQHVLIPVAAAVLLSFILTPAVTALQRRGLGRLPAVAVTVVLTFVLIVGLAWVLLSQIRSLAEQVSTPEQQKKIETRIQDLQSGDPGVLSRLAELATAVNDSFSKVGPPPADSKTKPVAVRIVSEAKGLDWLAGLLGPLVEPLVSVVLVIFLVIFMLMHKEDLRNRLIRLVGSNRLTVATRALDEAGQRISRYLLMLLVVNGSFGALFALGMALGRFFFAEPIQYVLLWGFLTAILRFIPYVGSWTACALPLLWSIAVSSDWGQPLYIFGLFLVLELFSNGFAEPLLYGRNVGISEVALLIAAAFWTWLWGPIGLILSTPMTACLVTLGRYVPQLEFFHVLLGSEPVLAAYIRYYQRLLARDQDEAAELVEEYLEEHTAEEVYDDVLVPALVQLKHDRAAGEASEEDEDFTLQVTRELLEDTLAPQQQLSAIAREELPPEAVTAGAELPRALVLGCPARDEEDELALRMFRQMLEPAHAVVEVVSVKTLTSEVLEKVREEQPAVVCIASLPPGGQTHTRYLCKRLRGQFPELKIVVGRWGQKEAQEKISARLTAAGANAVAMTLADTYHQVVPLLQVATAAVRAKVEPPRPVSV